MAHSLPTTARIGTRGSALALRQTAIVADLLRERGAAPLLYPSIAIAPTSESDTLAHALMTAIGGGYDWLVLTSANTVAVLAGCFAARIAAEGIPLDNLRQIAVACIGPLTRAVAEALGFDVAVVPPVYTLPALLAV